MKKHEPGLVGFCQSHGWPFHTFTADQLKEVPGEFSPSVFVSRVTGVDNVCERSAVALSGGTLIAKKFAADGVTMAAGLKPFRLDWRWIR